MFKVEIQPNWQLRSLDGQAVVQRLIVLLVGISEEGSLTKACTRAQLSYRYAWGILRSGQKILGTPLVESTRASGRKRTARVPARFGFAHPRPAGIARLNAASIPDTR